MSKIFLDTNVVLDAFLPDRPYSEASKQILSFGSETTRLYLSSLSVANVAFILRKNLGKEKAMDIVKLLFKDHFVLPVDDMDVYKALRSDCPDFEDAMQISCADYKDCDCIITGNVKHFKGYSPIPVFSPEEFLDGVRKAARRS